MSFTESIFGTYNVQVRGKGTQPVLFAHGLACDQNVWKYVATEFEDDYKVILFDFIGSGSSDIGKYDRIKYASLNGYAKDILDICEALELKEVIFIGHSVSSMIGLLAAIKKPELFSRLIMIGPSPCYLNEPSYSGGFDRKDIEHLLSMMKENYAQWTNYFTPIAMGNPDKPDLTENLKEIFCSSDPGITCEFARVTFLSDNRKDLSSATIPSLILQTEEDIVAPKHVGEYVHQNLPGSTLNIMKATGHFPHLSAPSETVKMIRQYLKPD